jgi:hypothetical protein
VKGEDGGLNMINIHYIHAGNRIMKYIKIVKKMGW